MLARRQLLKLTAAILATPASSLLAQTQLPLIQRKIPSSGELLTAIGLGTSRTFDTSNDADSLARLTEIIKIFFHHQGRVIDSSPMYGEAEARVGDVLRTLGNHPKVFAATKVWTRGREQGIAQMQASAQRMNIEVFDLIAVHNLVDWRTQLDTLKQWKAEGKVRYIGITTSSGRDHEELMEIMRKEPLDFVQFSYNIDNLTAEKQLLPLAQDKGIALSLIHISEPTRPTRASRMPSSA